MRTSFLLSVRMYARSCFSLHHVRAFCVCVLCGDVIVDSMADRIFTNTKGREVKSLRQRIRRAGPRPWLPARALPWTWA